MRTEKLYVENFWNIVEFLNEKLETERDEVFSYYYPLTRTLTEIYAELTYLVNQDDNKKFGICVAQYLFQLSQRYRYRKIKGENNSLKDLYGKLYKKFEANLLNLPERIEDFSKNHLKNSGFDFPTIKEIITKLNLDDLAATTKGLFPILTNEAIYDLLYRVPSNFLHGKIYHSMIPPDMPKRWIVIQVEILSFLFIEMVDKKFLNKETKEDIEKLASEFESNRPDFVNLWQAKRQL
ncbi:MAG TPA: DUF5677 domain-containing protein [Candidatus Brocadiia bacterium]|nr:hypothetical protein [Planctomycetota bacterium]MDO8093280.1 DUF5677 domain-containing protein [Candidatus Brocadiales bacterium]